MEPVVWKWFILGVLCGTLKVLKLGLSTKIDLADTKNQLLFAGTTDEAIGILAMDFPVY